MKGQEAFHPISGGDAVSRPRRKPAVAALRGRLDAGDDAALDLPTPGAVTQIAEPADLRIAGLGTPYGDVLGEIGDAIHEDAVAGDAEDVADAVALQPVHGLGDTFCHRGGRSDCHRGS